jgi:anti-sigma factor RsiW
MSNLNENDVAELTAYLDGELDDRASQEIEARISRDPALRAEAEALKKTWELLDYLPHAEPSAGFTHKTLERLTVRDLQKARRSAGRSRYWGAIAWAAAVLVAVGAGVWASSWIWPAPSPRPAAATGPTRADVDAQIVRDLDVVKRKRLYQHADDIDFARKLSDVFGD